MHLATSGIMDTYEESIKKAEDSINQGVMTFPICAVCGKNPAPQIILWEGKGRCVCWECQQRRTRKIEEFISHLPEGNVSVTSDEMTKPADVKK